MVRPSLVSLCILLTGTLALAADDASFLTVAADAEIQATPDIAIVQAGVVAQADDARDAQAKVNALISKVIDSIKQAGLDEHAIQTSQLMLYPVYANQQGKQNAEPKIVGYRATNTVSATIDDLSKVGPVIDAALGTGANQLNSLSFELKNDTDARAQALQQAAKNAMQKARVLADAMNVTLRVPVEISESATVNRPPMPVYGARMMSADTPVQAGQVTVTASVQIRYRVSPK